MIEGALSHFGHARISDSASQGDEGIAGGGSLSAPAHNVGRVVVRIHTKAGRGLVFVPAGEGKAVFCLEDPVIRGQINEGEWFEDVETGSYGRTEAGTLSEVGGGLEIVAFFNYGTGGNIEVGVGVIQKAVLEGLDYAVFAVGSTGARKQEQFGAVVFLGGTE